MQHDLSQEMLQDLREAFTLCDRDGDGEINFTDLSFLFRSLGFQREESEIKSILQMADTDNNGTITFPEFVIILIKSLSQPQLNRRHFIKAFKAFDSNGDGYVSKSDLQRINAAFGKVISEKEASWMLESVDVDGDKNVDLEEFTSLLTSGIFKQN